MSLEKLKLSKPLVTRMTEMGYLQPKEIQARILPRIIGGQDVVAIGPQGCGKTTAYVLATLSKLKYGFEEAPRALILVPTRQHLDEVMACFELINRNKSIRIVPLHNDESTEVQVNEVTDGCDIVVALPNRARAIYLKLGLNVNKLQLFVVDDASEMVKQGLQLPVNELAASAQKCQHLVFTDVLHERVEKMIVAFMREPAYVEVDEMGEETLDIHTQVLYHLPNFRTKLNLLNLLLADREVFDKAIVLVNTRLTAQTLANDLFDGKAEDIYVLKPLFYDDRGFETFAEFKADTEARVLIIAREVLPEVDLSNVPFVFQFELPEDSNQYINQLVKRDEQDLVFLTFVNDLELPQLQRISQAVGQKFKFSELPTELHIDQSNKKADTKKNKVQKEQELADAYRAMAFHEKKASNAKTENVGAGKKVKLEKKKKYGG